MPNPYPLLRKVALAEGLSFLLLLGVAMPLKYWAGMPMAVMVVGSIHGGLFVLFGWCWLRTWEIARWPLARAAAVFAAALLPFGPFVLDRGMRAWEQEHLQRGR